MLRQFNSVSAKRRRLGLTLVSGCAVLMLFTNCDIYSNNSAFNSQSSVSCSGDKCYVSAPQNLALESVPQFSVYSTQLSMDVGGDCNDGAYVDNEIRWSLIDTNGNVISTCTSKVGYAPPMPEPTCGVCRRGRWTAFSGNLGFPVGLGGSPVAVRFQIVGFTANGRMDSNPLLGTLQVPVVRF